MRLNAIGPLGRRRCGGVLGGLLEEFFGKRPSTPQVNQFMLIPRKGVVRGAGCATMTPEEMNTGSYRYGFNGKENDNEVKGDGGSRIMG